MALTEFPTESTDAAALRLVTPLVDMDPEIRIEKHLASLNAAFDRIESGVRIPNFRTNYDAIVDPLLVRGNQPHQREKFGDKLKRGLGSVRNIGRSVLSAVSLPRAAEDDRFEREQQEISKVRESRQARIGREGARAVLKETLADATEWVRIKSAVASQKALDSMGRFGKSILFDKELDPQTTRRNRVIFFTGAVAIIGAATYYVAQKHGFSFNAKPVSSEHLARRAPKFGIQHVPTDLAPKPSVGQINHLQQHAQQISQMPAAAPIIPGPDAVIGHANTVAKAVPTVPTPLAITHAGEAPYTVALRVSPKDPVSAINRGLARINEFWNSHFRLGQDGKIRNGSQMMRPKQQDVLDQLIVQVAA